MFTIIRKTEGLFENITATVGELIERIEKKTRIEWYSLADEESVTWTDEICDISDASKLALFVRGSISILIEITYRGKTGIILPIITHQIRKACLARFLPRIYGMSDSLV